MYIIAADQKKDMKLVRVGPESSIHTKVKSYSLEELTRKHFNKNLIITNAEAADRNKELLRELKNVEIEIEELKGTIFIIQCICFNFYLFQRKNGTLVIRFRSGNTQNTVLIILLKTY